MRNFASFHLLPEATTPAKKSNYNMQLLDMFIFKISHTSVKPTKTINTDHFNFSQRIKYT